MKLREGTGFRPGTFFFEQRNFVPAYPARGYEAV